MNRPTPSDEDAAAPVAVAERPAEQDQRGERQQVAVEDPLQGAGRCVEVAADVGQRDVDHGAVEEGHPRAQDGDGEHPATGGAVEGDFFSRGCGTVAQSVHQPLTTSPSPSRRGPKASSSSPSGPASKQRMTPGVDTDRIEALDAEDLVVELDAPEPAITT